MNRYPDDGIDYVQTWFHWKILALLCKIFAGIFVVVAGIFAMVAGGLFGQGAELSVIWCMFAAPVIFFVALCIYQVFKPRKTKHEKWRRQQAARPWAPEHAEPWKSAHPVRLSQPAPRMSPDAAYDLNEATWRTRVEPTFTLRR